MLEVAPLACRLGQRGRPIRTGGIEPARLVFETLSEARGRRWRTRMLIMAYSWGQTPHKVAPSRPLCASGPNVHLSCRPTNPTFGPDSCTILYCTVLHCTALHSLVPSDLPNLFFFFYPIIWEASLCKGRWRFRSLLARTQPISAACGACLHLASCILHLRPALRLLSL